MQYHIQTLVKHLFDKDSFEQVTVQELKQFTDDYPYAAVGQFLYAKKLKDTSAYNHYEQGEHTSLYFNNALWLRFLLNKKEEAPAMPVRQDEAQQQPGFRIVVQMPKTAGVPPVKEQEAQTAAPVPETAAATDTVSSPAIGDVAEQPITSGQPVDTSAAADAVVEADTPTSAESTPAVQEGTPAAAAVPEVASAVAIAEISQLVDENNTAAVNAVSITEEALAPPAVAAVETTAPVETGELTDAVPVAAEEQIAAAIPAEPIAEPVSAGVTEPDTTPDVTTATEATVQQEQAAPVQEQIPAELLVAEEEQLPLVEDTFAATPPAVPAAETTITPAAPVAAPAEQPQPVEDEAGAAAQTPANLEIKGAIDLGEPIFESYHTIDYFASQGIKLQQEDFKDRLGKQLKSFTEWLRSMKRIGPMETSTSLDEITNKSIQRIAEHSVEEKEVLTEAMAEVWVKQGHIPKAIQVYEKLSLLNPSKSAYFAGRIQQLKALS
jgi:hypothetical protein